ncbi:MAG TPA: hypothetical protein VFA60_05380 [Terriglobales bacterium]|nr:hypothetical protein [Terriglobales bacterium]
MMNRWAPAGLLLIALAAFVAPMLRVSGNAPIHFTGTELVMGTTFQPGSPLAFLGHVQPEPAAQLAAAGCLLALVAASLGDARWRRLGSLLAAGGVAAMLLLPWRSVSVAPRLVTRGMEIAPETGYYVALIALAAASVWLAVMPGAAARGEHR